MNSEEKNNTQMKLDTENLAMPEIHIAHKKENEEKELEEASSTTEENDEEIDFSGAMPEIHIHKKSHIE